MTIIAAISENLALGKINQLLWHLPDDFKRFKEVTMGHHIIMGRKTFESISKKALPKRTNIVITRDKNYECSCVVVANSLKKALQIAHRTDSNPYVIGGGIIYEEAMKIADKLDLTIVHHTFEADVFFPEIDFRVWKETSRIFHPKDEKHVYDFSFVTYERIGIK
jgi:dihydrofolate reductase